MRRIVGLLLLALFLLACSPVAAATKENAQVVLKPAVVWGAGPNLQGTVREAGFLLGTKDNYAIDCRGGIDASDAKKPYTPGKGGYCMGMPGPVATGWYCYGFLKFALNGQEASTTRASGMFAAEQGRRAILDSIWHMNAADVRVRFLGLPGRDLLFCEMTVDPRQTIKSLGLTAMCIPAYFTSAYGQREQARFVQTPSLLIREEEGRRDIRLVPKDNWWLLYGDDYFDVAKTRESDGPCAMMVLPEDVATLTIPALSYGVTTTVSVAPATRTIRMAFWKMKGRTNAEAADYFRTNAEKIRGELASLDFTPKSVKTFDLAGMTAEIERIARSESVGKEFQKRAAEVLAWIKAGSADLTKKSDGVNATERKLQLVDKYAGFVYEARLAELLASLEKTN